MSSIRFDNPGQVILVSLYAFCVASLFKLLPSEWYIDVHYFVLLLFALSFILCLLFINRLGHFIDFYYSKERLLCGLYAEVFFDDGKPRISLFRLTYSISKRKFSIKGISFQGRIVAPETIIFEPHSNWDSTGVVLRYVDDQVGGIFYSYNGSRFQVERDPSRPGYTWIKVSSSSEWTGYFSDIEGPFHKRRYFRCHRIRGVGGSWSDNLNSDSRYFSRFKSDEYKGAALLTKICQAITSQQARSEAGEIVQGVQTEGLILPAGFVQWVRDLPVAEEKAGDPSQRSILIKETLERSRRGYARYSNFQVIACLVSSSGTHHFGVNCENGSFPEGMCAEAVAIGAMVTAGEQKISELYLHSPTRNNLVPCGGCLQKIREFADPDISIHSIAADGTLTSHPLSTLFPAPFQLPEIQDEKSSSRSLD